MKTPRLGAARPTLARKSATDRRQGQNPRLSGTKTAALQKAAKRPAKGHLLQDKRRPFTEQKTANNKK